ncbi:MAG: tetratricopeptide repeat protein [Campylobacteraceae bacterium]|jgi:tetratricopeptide (TPR) repeat protein|nr:tetratricopeptide repeat protein [Campylobacteraceae bacterium]
MVKRSKNTSQNKPKFTIKQFFPKHKVAIGVIATVIGTIFALINILGNTNSINNTNVIIMSANQTMSGFTTDPKSPSHNYMMGKKSFERKEYKKALEYFIKALDEQSKSNITDKINNLDTAKIYNSIGTTYRMMEDYEKAIENFDHSAVIFEEISKDKTEDIALVYRNIARVYIDQNKYDEALELLEKALKIYEKELGKDHLETAFTYNFIAMTYHKQDVQYNKALEFYKKALEVYEEKLGKDHSLTASVYGSIASAYSLQNIDDESLKRYHEALRWSLKDLKVKKEELGKNHPDIIAIYSDIVFACNYIAYI